MNWQKIDFRSAIVDSERLHSFGRRLERSPEQRNQQVLNLLFTSIKAVQQFPHRHFLCTWFNKIMATIGTCRYRVCTTSAF